MKDRRYFVTGAVSGTPMKAYLINGQRPFGEEECIKRLEPLIRELGEAHAAGESGFTICPDNLLVQEDGTVVLGGDAAERRICEGFSPIEHYYTKAVIGTWSDVYAMCATLLYCMTGKTPPSPIKRMSGENLDLYGISPAVAAVLEKGLKIRAEDRIQTLGELADSLLGADTVDRTVFVAPAKKEVAAAVFSETPDVGGTIYQAAPEDESKTEIHAWPNINKSAPAEGRTVQQQFEIDTATQSKVSARKAAAEEKRLSETLPPKDEPPVRKKKSAWKTAVPLAVLAVVAGISFFTFRDRWIDPAVRESLPSEEPAQVQQTAEPATAESPRVVEEISAMDTKQLVPATTDAAAESPEPEITYAETKPLVPEASAPEPQDTTLIDQILRVFDSNTTVTADNQETQAVQVSNTAETAGEAQPTNDNNGNTRSADQSATYNAPAPGEDSTPAPGEDNAPVSAATKDDTSTQTVPGDNEADKVPPKASPEDINNMPPKESGFTEDGLKALTGKYGEVIQFEKTDRGLLIRLDRLMEEGEVFRLRNALGAIWAGLVGIASAIVALVMFLKLCKAFEACRSPFDEAVIRRMNIFAWTLIVCAVVGSFAGSAAQSAVMAFQNAGIHVGAKNFGVSLDLYPIFAALIVFFLCMIFRYGAQLQREADETL